ncbi:hypothetical protein PHMEG_00019059 [Phytophthora megakarya]|uniref:Uncharacterized protein n=1 Tax=Phytophthora megakarya TaxID=4795 RepID=A0A225VSV7_9STRA|nr:hypothetical protein PHMEG_00019059 [Phytophthora megakarya]
MTAIASYGGYSMPDYGAAHRFDIGDPFYQPYSGENAAHPLHKGSGPDYGTYPKAESIASVAPAAKEQKPTHFEFGLPPSVTNAGKTGEDWWMYSRIDGFDTLRTRFYNQFICQTPLQMIERLKNAKCSKGMSAEAWGDVISNLCDAAQVVDPQMRYQYVLAGLRNKEWKTALQTTMVNDIPRAVHTLLYKNMHLPAEDEAEFEDEVTKKPIMEEGMMQQMLGLMQQTQNLLVTQNQLMARSPCSSRNRVSDTQPLFIAATYEDQTPIISAVAENAPNVAGGNRRMGPDQYTREGLSS